MIGAIQLLRAPGEGSSARIPGTSGPSAIAAQFRDKSVRLWAAPFGRSASARGDPAQWVEMDPDAAVADYHSPGGQELQVMAEVVEKNRSWRRVRLSEGEVRRLGELMNTAEEELGGDLGNECTVRVSGVHSFGGLSLGPGEEDEEKFLASRPQPAPEQTSVPGAII